jgi:2-keto-4-pentenoate hydratase/2-oxohepta-3-ene-1,7-dioic acid hydratase in catechol pathway
LALAANYQDHIVEAGSPRVDKARIVPKLFLKPSSSIIGPDEPLILPGISDTVDWELELAAVVGTRCRNLLGNAIKYSTRAARSSCASDPTRPSRANARS